MLKTILIALAALTILGPALAQEAPDAMRSPANRVYQFKALNAAYLWIPDDCPKVRGVLVFGQNVPESLIAGHPAIRQVCAENDLGIVLTTPSFWFYGGPQEKAVDRLQQMLDGLAKQSGYAEVATVPWLPIGESMSRALVKGMMDQKPDRCMAGIYACDIDFGTNRTVPLLGAQGTAWEWGQTNWDLRANWRDAGKYAQVCAERKRSPQWPVSLLVEAGGGHFNCSEPMLRYFAQYIRAVAKARLPEDGSPGLKPVDISKGFLAGLSTATSPEMPAVPAASATDVGQAWYFNRETAEAAQAIARVNWRAETAIPLVRNGSHCDVYPWNRNSVTTIDVATAADFALQPYLLDVIPPGFAAAGQPLAQTAPAPLIQWICGQAAPLGGNQFTVELDRNYQDRVGASACLAVVVPGDQKVRYSVQPLLLKLMENTNGTGQTITFNKLKDVKAGTRSVPLEATASSGLPVKYYVEAGPAVIDKNRLVLTPVPPRSSYPVEVTVVAWQWGTCAAPTFNKALVKQTFRIVK